jgi:glucose/arabinose dehydrogenase
MRIGTVAVASCLAVAGASLPIASPINMASAASLLSGADAFGDWHADAPGIRRLISPADLPPVALGPGAKEMVNVPRVVERPQDAMPQVPPGFHVQLFASGLENPRILRVAPNGDVFVAESKAGRIRVLRAAKNETQQPQSEIFASDLNMPFGIAFYPPGPDPQFVYIGNTDSVVRFAYRNGDLRARGVAEGVLAQIPTEGHWTRDLAFSPDGRRLFISVGSLSNAAETMQPRSRQDAQDFEKNHAAGSAWGVEQFRADVLVADPTGNNLRIFATGLRNCVGMIVHPETGDLWCTNNERDRRGDNLVPDFVTRVHDRDFFGWPWYYIGAREDPFHKGERPDLAEIVNVPDVLIQAHSAPLGLVLYDKKQFPPDYRGDIFVALHGSYNHSERTGYKIVRLLMRNGKATGVYEDFMTGFVVSDKDVWGRPVGLAVAQDGALLVSEDGNGTIWRVTH